LPYGTNITANTGFLLYAFLLKLCFFQHVNELYPPSDGCADLEGIEPLFPTTKPSLISFIVPPGKPKFNYK